MLPVPRKILLLLFTFCLAVQAHSQTRFYAFVNGGLDSSGNTWLHEQDILAFNNTLFKGSPTVLLSANGPEAFFSETDGNGNLFRRLDGATVLKKTEIGKNARPANLAEIRSLYAAIQSQRPDKAVVVYGDHGDQNGLSLWGEKLSTAEHFKLQSNVPASTLLRSIHIQCFAGSLLVDQTRELPKSASDLLPFLNTYYPPNKCGLALSRHDEMGQYNIRDGTWQSSPWTMFFSSSQPKNLANLQTFLNQDEGLAPTSVLTSNYLLDDLSEFYCKMGNKQNHDDRCEYSLPLAMTAALKEQLCDSTLEDQIKKQSIEMDENFKRWSHFQGLKKYWAEEYLKETNKDMNLGMEILSTIEYERYQLQIEASPEKKHNLEQSLARNLASLPSGFLEKYDAEIAKLTGSNNPEFNRFFEENCTAEWFNKDPLAKQLIFPGTVPVFEKKPVTLGCRDEERTSSQKMRRDQLELKALQVKNQERKAQILKGLLQDPNLAPIRERYENIKSCEASALN